MSTDIKPTIAITKMRFMLPRYFRKFTACWIVFGFLVFHSPVLFGQEDSESPQALTRADLLGSAAPNVDSATVIRPEGLKSFDLASAQGKLVVIKFWTTWCGPCVRGIPEFNELVNALADDPVVFISVTNENETVVQDFLQNRMIESIVLCDVTGRLFHGYGVSSLPAFVIVDRDGNIAALTDSKHISMDTLRQAIGGDFSGIKNVDLDFELSELTWQSSNPSWYVESKTPESLERTKFDSIIEISDAIRPSPMYQNQELGISSSDGWQLQDLIITAWDKSIFEIDIQYDDLQRRYRFAVKLPDTSWNPGNVQKALQNLVISAFPDLRVESREIEREVILLRRTDEPSSALRPTTKEKTGHDFSFGESRSSLELGNVSPKQFAVILGICIRSVDSDARELPVINETGLQQNLDLLPIEWETGDRESFLKAISQCGLAYEIVKRKIEIITCTKRGE